MSASKFTYLLVDDRGPARVITINRPEALNALNAEVIDELTVAVTEAAEDDAVRGLVLTADRQQQKCRVGHGVSVRPPRSPRPHRSSQRWSVWPCAPADR